MEPLFRTGHDASTGESWQEEIPAEELENIPQSVFVYESFVVEEESVVKEESVADESIEGEQP